MLRFIAFLFCLTLVVSCSNQPTAQESASSCGSGDCVKNLNKLGTPEINSAKKQLKTKKSKHL